RVHRRSILSARNDEGRAVKKRSLYSCTLAAAGATLVAAGAAVSTPARPADARGTPPMPPASSFSARVDNQWFPLKPGTRYVYTGVKDGKPSRDIVTVTHQTKTIDDV